MAVLQRVVIWVCSWEEMSSGSLLRHPGGAPHFSTSLPLLVTFVCLFCVLLVYVFWPLGMQDLSSPTRDQTHVPCIDWWTFNHWATREVPILFEYLFMCSVPQLWNVNSLSIDRASFTLSTLTSPVPRTYIYVKHTVDICWMQRECWSSRRMVNVSIKSVNTERFERKVKVKVSQSCPVLCNPRLLCPWNSPGQK